MPTGLLLAAALLAADIGAVTERAPAAVPDGETRDTVLLLPGGPLHLRLHIGMGGRSLAAARKELAERLMATLDTDGDGRLNRQEAARSPLLRTKQREAARQFLQSIGAPERMLELADIEKTIERFGGETVVYRQDATAAEPDKEVFAFLDLDGNGFLDGHEIAQAAERLIAKDEDGDQCISFDEIAPPAVVDPNDIIARMAALQSKPTATMSDKLRDLRDPFLARRLLAEYDRDRSKTLSASELSWTKERLAVLDVNADGVMDVHELARMLQSPVDLEVAVDLDPGEKAPPAVHILTAGCERLDSGDRPDFVKLRFRDAVISLSHRHIDPMARTMESAMRVFNRLDLDGNGYLDADEVRDSVRFERGLFELMDEDGDGKVFGDEMKRYVAMRGEPAATTCRVNLYDTGFGFFLALDQNGDGRISERERRTLHQALAKLDRQGTGVISAAEAVKHYHIEFVRGTYVLFGAPETATSQLPAFQRRPPVGPAWFQAMDRNNDGDISWEEFHGSRQDFEFIDADQDGLIDPQEAFRADEEYERQRSRVTVKN
jgi:Ca2+-binding EF-hand superfamily protein